MIEQEHTSQDWLEASRVCSVWLPITVSLGKQTSNIFHGESLNINENKVMGEKEDMKREGAKLLKEILNFSIKTELEKHKNWKLLQKNNIRKGKICKF